MHIQSDVCIIGDGAIGKVAALGFAQAGLKVALLSPLSPLSASSNKAAQPPTSVAEAWDVRVYAVNHVAHNLLSSVKVWEALDTGRIAPVDSMMVNGDAAGELAFDAYGARVGTLAWIVEDRNLNQALDAALKFASNVRAVNGRAVDLKISDQAASVQLENGDTLSAELVIGADGGQSWVRSQCNIDFDYRPYGQRAIVSNFACEKPHHGAAHQWFSVAEGVIALLPLPGNQVSLVWSAPDALADTLSQESLTQLAARLSALAATELGTLTPLQPEVVKSFPLSLIRPHAITAARVALIGDAAHVVHPLAGHGMNLGFADVAGLIKAVVEREEHRDCGDARVLARYARSRKEDILLMQFATDGLARLFGTAFEPLRIARNLGLNLVNKLPVLKRRLIGHAMGSKNQ
ncbi:FAD-dependent monooxygenase [Herminiimonas fonticola]|uniref:Ubiquinone biosynthesis UbiH/UbiF/VisC/COQ6 family hydroxylase n=1 Tax=Herminiimonas fonticola TaxID=303380 RepID=A0A4R6GFF9_9BURK|nr:FAD-dependent monooxygenase [Herminiimonas fonticola]RBA24380.1 Ubi-OHases: ubiquinone biosynthesis hydroxylase [Herminiimonas fonticola]TDN93497.1 ubiquinone biosynthesis UbiH/UbiF/VisC/COQ6 family hydroxylase [Herminiimonas fonticola]